jgi:VIT1/CCC1 family predicted Fe2+/Mn2+ transporter
MLMQNAYSALLWSVIITLAALAVFGYIKGRVAGLSAVRSAVQTTFIGGLAAAAAFALARLLSVK